MSQNTRNSAITVRFGDGGIFHTTTDSAFEYLLDPVFTRFAFICLIISGVLFDRADLGFASSSNHLTLWSVLFLTTMAWLIIAVRICTFLLDRGIISMIFTPLVSLPMVPINEFASQYLAILIVGGEWQPISSTFGWNMKYGLVVLCYDILHGRYVAPAHPTFIPASTGPDITGGHATDFGQSAEVSTRNPRSDIAPSSEDQASNVLDMGVASSRDAQSSEVATTIVTFANKRLDVSKLLSIQSEDHYLNITLENQQLHIRGKLSAIIALLDLKLGMQVNRSTWLAFQAIAAAQDIDGGRIEVTLKNGDQIIIPKARKLFFQQQYGLFQTPASVAS